MPITPAQIVNRTSPAPQRLSEVTSKTDPVAKAPGSPRFSDGGELVGRLDRPNTGKPPPSRYQRTDPHRSGGQVGIDEYPRQTTPRPTRPVASPTLRDHSRTHLLEQYLLVRDIPDLHHAIAIFSDLSHARRLSTSRVVHLAAAVNMDLQAFQAVATGSAAATAQAGDLLPAHLMQLRQQWTQEDNEARRARRARATADLPRPERPAEDNPIDKPTSNDALGRGLKPDAVPETVNESARKPGPSVVSDERSRNLDGREREPSPKSATVPSQAPLPPTTGERAAVEIGSAGLSCDVIDRALVSAFAADVKAEAQRQGKSPSAAASTRGIAVRLRITGRSRAEVEVVLASIAVPAKTEIERDHIARAITKAIGNAFSEETTRKLRTRTKFAARVRAIEERTEAREYRRLRRKALDKLRRDLDAVWTERRMRADEAALRHARRLKLLNDLRWRTERVRRRRSGLVMTILSVLVEAGVLRPLIARQHALAAEERRAINDAAAHAASELKRLRQEWRSDIAGQDGYDSTRANNISARPPTSASLGRVGNARAEPGGLIHPPEQEQSVIARGQIIASLALVMAARGAWSHRHAGHLSRLIHVGTDELWSLACGICRQHHGHGQPKRLTPEQISTKWTTAWQGASQLRWHEVLALMNDIATSRAWKGRDDNENGQGL